MFCTPDDSIAPPWVRANKRLLQSSFRSFRIVCGVTSKRSAKSSTKTLPDWRAKLKICDWRGVKTSISNHSVFGFQKALNPSATIASENDDRFTYIHFFSFNATLHCEIFVAVHNAFVILAIDVRFVSFDSACSSGNKGENLSNGGS
jgi:hypothetical protein